MVKITVMDSDVLCCRKMDGLLKKNGYECNFFLNGKLGLEYLRRNSSDIIFCDTGLLDIEEEDILYRLKNICPKTSVIITTSHPNIRSAVGAIKNGASDYLCKPFLPDEVLQVI